MNGAVKAEGTLKWQYAHILWQKRGLRMEEFAEMPEEVQLAYIASEELATERPLNANDKLAHVYIRTSRR